MVTKTDGGELILTNKRLVFINQNGEDAAATFVKQVDVPLEELIDVALKRGWFGRCVNVGSGMGNIRLYINGIDDNTFGEFKSALESASGKGLTPN